MKIGVDIRQLTRKMAGIGRYTLEMCRALNKMPDISLYLYASAPIDEQIAKAFHQTTIRTTRRYNRVIERFIWQKYLPQWAKIDQLDLFWGPSHRLPFGLPKQMARAVTIHDLVWRYYGETMKWSSRLIERLQMPFAIRDADRIIAVSQATADAIIKEFPQHSDKVAAILSGVTLIQPETSIDVINQFNLGNNYCLFVGTVEPRKNLPRLLSAYAKLPATIKEQTSLAIVGDPRGWGHVNLQEKISQLNLEPHVHLLGYVDEATLAALYTQTQFLVMPSLYEGFGLPLVEAMARGKPVLTSNSSAMPEIAGDAGLLVDPTDVDSISKGLQMLITDSDLRNQLAANTATTTCRFNWDSAASQLVDNFKQAIIQRGSSQ